MLSGVDDQTAQWAQQKSRELFHLLTHYKCAMMEIETRFNLLNEEYALFYGRSPVNSIQTRVKTLQSIREKLERRGLPMTPAAVRDNLNDIAGVRVICAFPEDVYTLSDALLRQEDITLLRRKDYIAQPKPNGYRSLHLIVTVPIYLSHEKRPMKVEIQLRTIAMDFWASLEHQLRYKSDAVFTEEMAQELYQCAQLSADLDDRMDRLRQSVQGAAEEP
jgi:putative GTP pyrophosphokinase